MFINLCQIKLILIILSPYINCDLIKTESNSTGSIKDGDGFKLEIESKKLPFQSSKHVLDVGIFVDQRFIDRCKSTGMSADKYLLYALKTLDLRFNEPAIKSIFNDRISFAIVYYELTTSKLWTSLDTNLDANTALLLADNYAKTHVNRSKYGWNFSLFITGNNFASSPASDDNRRKSDVLGLAAVGAVCNGAALVEMTTFDGWWVLLHEVGHIFGATHDYPYLGCDDSYSIMADSVSPSKTQWTQCSLNAFSNKLKSSYCFTKRKRKGKPLEEFNLPTNLPGNTFNLHDICRTGRSINAQYIYRHSCRLLTCRLKWFQWTTLALPEGTPCGKGFICCAGECVSIGTCNVYLGLSG